ncbi:MAG: response regulator [Desulfobacteraceae bacterium]
MTSPIRVLMVDDEERFRNTTSRLLVNRGFITTIAASGEEALGILKSDPQDVVILDIKMPDMDGHQVLEKIRENFPDTQVIMLTGHGTGASARKALVDQAFDYLSKPCAIDLLTTKIHDAYMAKQKPGLQQEKTVRDIMIHIEDYSKILEEDTVKDAIITLMDSFNKFVSSGRIMETGHRSLLVYDRNDKVVGILSIMDLLQALRPAYLSAAKPSMADTIQYSPMFWTGLFTSQVKTLALKQVGEIMSERPLAVDQGANLMEVADLMFASKIRRMLVTDMDKIVGVVREQELFFEIANIVI